MCGLLGGWDEVCYVDEEQMSNMTRALPIIRGDENDDQYKMRPWSELILWTAD